MQAWPPAPPPGQNYYELSSVFSANGLAPQVSYGAAKPHVPRYNANHRPNIRNKRNNHDHRPHNSVDPNQQQQQNQNVNPGHRSIHGSSGSIHQQPHHHNPIDALSKSIDGLSNSIGAHHHHHPPPTATATNPFLDEMSSPGGNGLGRRIHNQSQQSVVPMYKPTTAIISHGGNSAKSSDIYHYNNR